MIDFNAFIDTIGTAEEMDIIKHAGNLSEENQRKIVNFIKKNNIDCNHLWEDNKEGDKAGDDWEKLVEFVLPLIPDEDI
ncbi:MAG: hypothetical protein SPL13_00975 [Clostridia bacterium]|nr:hypothetical protein [Clostridia bacterium]